MSELTIEKIMKTNGYVNSEEIGFLLSYIKMVEGLLEIEQEDCEQVRKNKELNWQRAIVAESSLNIIERDTAMFCADLSEDLYNHSNPAMCTHEYNDDVASRIRGHFKICPK